MHRFTVVLLPPDNLMDNYVLGRCLVHVVTNSGAVSIDEAALQAGEKAFDQAIEYSGGDTLPSDWRILAIFPGHHDDINPEG